MIAGNDLMKVLTQRLGLVSPIFDLERVGNQKLSGSVVSDTFVGLADSERQQRIWDALDAEYGPRSTQEVGTLLAYTRAEWDIDLAGAN